MDLQDDLADVVMWLAENWTLELPTPDVRPGVEHMDSGEHVPTLGLIVRCETPAQLHGFAELLAVPVTVDARPDGGGVPALRATRQFRRVCIELVT
ncbi:MAG TPA: hypothetical protein VH479_11345 [Acidimicrobiales bacterium]|jgi:hypothetical protein